MLEFEDLHRTVAQEMRDARRFIGCLMFASISTVLIIVGVLAVVVVKVFG